jgi:uncharacterized protein YecE (DUF72 family)
LVFVTLASWQAAMLADTEDGATPFVGTASFGYLRLRSCAYSDQALAEWARQIRQQDWKDCYVFFKHEDEGTGPALARRFVPLVERL